MEPTELQSLAKRLLESPSNTEEFTLVFSMPENWNALDKQAIPVPNHTAMSEGECPECYDTIRVLFDKYAQHDYEFTVTCPHCGEVVECNSEFTGYTAEVTIG